MVQPKDRPYATLSVEELILRDLLAADRTILANQRTLLAYIRTALAVFVAGVSFLQFWESMILDVLGLTFIPVSVAIMVYGGVRYQRMAAVIRHINSKQLASVKSGL